MEYKMLDFFSTLSDVRRGQGQRHKLHHVLSIVIMAILSGHQGLRGFTRFAESNREELIELFRLKHGVPCFYTFRSVLQSLDEQLLAQRFISWVGEYHSALKDKFLSLDGKAITSSVHGGNTGLQNFISVVSAFGHQSGIVYGMKSFENGKSGEAEALRALVQQLGLNDKVFTMDALHTKKNL